MNFVCLKVFENIYPKTPEMNFYLYILALFKKKSKISLIWSKKIMILHKFETLIAWKWHPLQTFEALQILGRKIGALFAST